jgi:hypothetical protein
MKGTESRSHWRLDWIGRQLGTEAPDVGDQGRQVALEAVGRHSVLKQPPDALDRIGPVGGVRGQPEQLDARLRRRLPRIHDLLRAALQLDIMSSMARRQPSVLDIARFDYSCTKIVAAQAVSLIQCHLAVLAAQFHVVPNLRHDLLLYLAYSMVKIGGLPHTDGDSR